MSQRRRRLAVCLATLCLVASAALGQESRPANPAPAEQEKPKDEVGAIDELIQQGLAAWRKKDEARAAELLQQAVAKIQARAARDLGTFLPKAAKGWSFGEAQIDSGSWGGGETAMQWSNATVDATRESDGVTARVQITNSPQIYQGMKSMVAVQQQMKAILRQQGKDVDVRTKEGFEMVTIVEDGSAFGWIVGKRIVVVLNLDAGERATLDAMVGWLDLAGLAKLDGR